MADSSGNARGSTSENDVVAKSLNSTHPIGNSPEPGTRDAAQERTPGGDATADMAGSVRMGLDDVAELSQSIKGGKPDAKRGKALREKVKASKIPTSRKQTRRKGPRGQPSENGDASEDDENQQMNSPSKSKMKNRSAIDEEEEEEEEKEEERENAGRAQKSNSRVTRSKQINLKSPNASSVKRGKRGKAGFDGANGKPKETNPEELEELPIKPCRVHVNGFKISDYMSPVKETPLDPSPLDVDHDDSLETL